MPPGTSETRLGSSPSRPLDAVNFAPGTVLADRYRIVALVGRGGMGEVYRADDLRLGQPVALKFLPAALEQDPTARERLLAEVRNARTISHPNVCRVYDAGELEDRYFLTMEYIDGENLASLLRRIGRLPAGKALEIARQLCAGLAAAHERGVLHRDLKPANVMIDGRGQARITDFGLAVELGPAALAGNHSESHGELEVAGTVAYLAPERFEGRPATAQSDIYALGLVLDEIYTGKHAIAATTVEGWRRAHSDTTPSHPSAIVTDIEPPVERAILRCWEKDPARRPASVTQLAAALPGGDPLAAAIAAGETPSPELVAASGEEGTLPRAQAWRWFAACLVALALAVPLGSSWQLANIVQLEKPAVQSAAVHQIMRTLGYPDPPTDSAWWVRPEINYLVDLVETQPPSTWFTAPIAYARAMHFCYRQSSAPLFTSNPFGNITLFEPGVFRDDDTYVELDGRGRLLALRVGGLSFRQVGPAGARPVDWNPLFAAAGLDYAQFADVPPRWPAVVTSDESGAWEGSIEGEPLRVEASAHRGRVVQFLVMRAPAGPAVRARARAQTAERWQNVGTALIWVITIFVLAGLAALAALARHNLRMGRGDRKGAVRIAVAMTLAELVFVILNRHWAFQPFNVLLVVLTGLGLPLFTGVQVWLYYVGLEPLVRRRWPHMLIAWTRLVDGRWRDPLVGRSLIVGCTAALVAVGIVPGLASILTTRFGLPLSAPWYQPGTVDGGLGWFLVPGVVPTVGPALALIALTSLLIARLVLRNNRAAWALLFCLMFVVYLWWAISSRQWASSVTLWWFPATQAALSVYLLSKHGLLAAAVFFTASIAVLNTPLTYNVSHLYAWRTGVVVVMIAGLALWGFRNVLGRQSAFPEGSLEG